MNTELLIAIAALTALNSILILRNAVKHQNDPMLRELTRLESSLREEIGRNRDESSRVLKENREEMSHAFKTLLEQMNRDSRDNRTELNAGLKGFQEATENRLEKVRETVEGRLVILQEDNSRKLEEMRVTVDEKLQASVEKRFNDSFRLISDRLDQVHKGLGEMQTLANGVGDLKKVLTNVKTRGTLGEIQLGSILEQFLAPDQYEKNAAVKEGSLERVEFAVRLPGNAVGEKPLLLPVDSKFPVEDYQRLIEAYERSGDLSPAELESYARLFENAVRKNAKDIRDKYLNPPVTTDFAIMFVPTEGLYAEILRRTGLFESLQRDLKITVVGPSNLAAFLSSLQMGFRTLAIEKRSSEVWEVLGAVKTEFGLFGQILDKTRKKLVEAANVIDKAGVRSRSIERRLRHVEALPKDEARQLLGDSPDLEEEPVILDIDVEEEDRSS